MAREWITKRIAGIKSFLTPKKIPEPLKNRLEKLGIEAKLKGSTVIFKAPEDFDTYHDKDGILSTRKPGIITYWKDKEELAKLKLGCAESVFHLLNVHKEENAPLHLKLLSGIKKQKKG